MFILLQLPFADLRPMVKGELGRMPTPDWTADDPGETFVRGFGKMATRLTQVYGLLGERAFADFNNAVRFPTPMAYRQDEWLSPMQVRLWFRRLYFDGKLAGRFEFGFIMGDNVDEQIEHSRGSFAYDISRLAAAVQNLPVIVRSLDGQENHAKLSTCGEALGCAYLMATTGKSELSNFPPAETINKHLALGSPLIQMRVSNGKEVKPSRDRRVLDGTDSEIFITSATPATERNNVVVHLSPTGVFAESPQERATRVLISHMHALMFAEAHFLRASKVLGLGSKSTLADAVKDMLDRFQRLGPTGPLAESDKEFHAALKVFANGYSGRAETLTRKLEEFAAELAKPSTASAIGTSVKGAIQWLTELVVTAGVKTGVQIALKGS
jgi:hypothetical protein